MAFDRQHILDEIRRTSAANGGAPLGVRAFLRETGIKQSDWRGRFWARWSDATREAGIAHANKLNTAFLDDDLLEKLAHLVRQLRRFPTEAELRLHRRSDPSFPDAKVYRRYGNKAGVREALWSFCATRSQWTDVIALSAVPASPATNDDAGDAGEVEAIGSVYLLRSGRHYKIGYSNAPGRRAREIALQLPARADTVHVIQTDDPPGIEHYWHRRFADKRRNGEWFELTAADVRAFKRRKVM